MKKNSIFSAIKTKVEDFIEKFEDEIDGTRLGKIYFYIYRKFNHGWLNPRVAYYSVKRGIKNLIKWFPFIWNDRDWDYCYWIEMNYQKLKSMEYNIRHNSYHVGSDKTADNIRKAMLALKRLREDDYLHNAMIFHDKKWGKSDFRFEPCNDGTGCSTMEIDVENATTEKLKEQESNERRRCYRHSEYMKKQDLEYATKIINKYLFHWWD